MKKLKYGLLLILSMILFSVPVLAAKTTYYLPSKVVYGDGYEYYTYSYDKYGHMTEFAEHGEESENKKFKWKYKYDKNGKRISGEEYINGKLCYKLTFDKNDRLKTETSVGGSGETLRFKWNSKGYPGGNGVKYYYYKNGNIKKMESYIDGKLSDVAYFDKSGLRSKNPPKRNGYKETYEYVLDKKGLVKTKTTTSEDTVGYNGTMKSKVTFYYSKTKTDAKTYYLFIDGWDVNYINSSL